MIATNYIEIYIVRGYDEKIGREYAILAVLMQIIDSQQVITERRYQGLREEQSTPRKMPNRGTKQGLSSLETWRFEVRLGSYRKTKDG